LAGDELLAEVFVARRVGGELEEQPVPLGIGAQVGGEVGADAPGLLGQRVVAVEDRLDLLEPRGEALVEHGQEQLLLGAEVRVEGALGEAGLLGDLVDRRLLQPAAREDPPGRLHQARARVGPALGARHPRHAAAPTMTSAPRSGTRAMLRRDTRSLSGRTGRSGAWARIACRT